MLQNKISHLFLQGSDLQKRENEVLKDASKRLNFIPEKLLDRSSWWGSKEIGAFRYIGQFQGKRVILKIQGVKPLTSEIYMIKAFSDANQSKILRPPLLYSYLCWDDEKRYEALVLELVDGKPIVNYPANKSELEQFFNLREEYRKKCVINPWIEKPRESISTEIETNFRKWRESAFKLYPIHPLRKEEDLRLIDNAVEILANNYQKVERDFQHGHFGVSDLVKAKDGHIVILSNLYWSWKPPFYDAVFGFHWFILNLAKLVKVTPEIIDKQNNIWLSKIKSLAKTEYDKKLLSLAFLERAAAGLNFDALSINLDKSMSKYLVERTRNNLMQLAKNY